ncbi:membrane protein [Bacteroidia bacterium]|nr:membrane protein [Bacteroidia bacterium]
MKKITIILAIFSFVLISSVRADIRLGVKAGVNLADASFNKSTIQTSNFTGYQVGPILEFKLPIVGIGLDVAVLYSQQGLKFKFDDVDFKERHSTLEIPVNLKFKFDLVESIGGYLTAGPYVSFKLDGDDFSGVSQNIKNDFKNESFGAGINVGGGLELVKHLQVGVNYKIGMTNDYKSLTIDDLNGKTRIWSITAAYFF